MSGSFSFSRYDRANSRTSSTAARARNTRTALGYWLPLAITVTVATIGIAAWVWNERFEDTSGDADYSRTEDRDYEEENVKEEGDEEEERRRRRENRRARRRSGSRRAGQEDDEVQEERREGIVITDDERREEDITTGGQTIHGEQREDTAQYTGQPGAAGGTLMARVSDAIRRTPSPLQIFERVAGRTFGFGERERWEEEVERRSTFGGVGASVSGAEAVEREVRQQVQQHRQGQVGRRRVVAVVVSAEAAAGGLGDDEAQYHSSILSHIPEPPNPQATQLLALVYAPHLTSHPLSPKASDPISTPGKALYDHLARTAQPLLQHETHLLPFTAPDSQINLLRHIAPNIVYIEESLATEDVVSKIRDWVGQVVVVIGAGSRGLVDTETESEGEIVVLSSAGAGGAAIANNKKWWKDDSKVGLGKGVEVVDAIRVEEDWVKRIGSQ